VNTDSIEVTGASGERSAIPFGLCIWASGVKPQSLAAKLAQDLQQSRSLMVDECLRVKGAEGSIFALGDACRIEHKPLKARARALFDAVDSDKNGVLNNSEMRAMMEELRGEFPAVKPLLEKMERRMLAQQARGAMSLDDPASRRIGTSAYATSRPKGVTYESFESNLADVDRKAVPLPPTAQVASQQGKYLGRVFNSVLPHQLQHADGFKPAFEYFHLGSMASTGGGTAVVDVSCLVDDPLLPGQGKVKGLAALAMWRGVYWSKTVSWRSKTLMLTDWAKAKVFGRDLSRI